MVADPIILRPDGRPARTPGMVNPMPGPKRIADINLGDFYPTAPYLTMALLNVEKFDGPIGEFACGRGHIAETIRHVVPNPVIASDLFDRGYGQGGIPIQNILAAKGEGAIANVITNPPYARGVINKFVDTAVRLSQRKTALLMKLVFMEGVKRHGLMEKIPFSRVWVFPSRPTFMPNRVIHDGDLVDGKPVKGTIAYAWFVWDKSHVGPPNVHWLSPSLIESLQKPSRMITDVIEERYALAA